MGALTDEMAIRDHFRVDVLVRVAANPQPVGVELAEIKLRHTLERPSSRT